MSNEELGVGWGMMMRMRRERREKKPLRTGEGIGVQGLGVGPDEFGAKQFVENSAPLFGIILDKREHNESRAKKGVS